MTLLELSFFLNIIFLGVSIFLGTKTVSVSLRLISFTILLAFDEFSLFMYTVFGWHASFCDCGLND